MSSNNKPARDHNARATVWREILVIYGLLIAALLWDWLA